MKISNTVIKKFSRNKMVYISKRRNLVMGCLLGGAVGDALGYRVEFNTFEEIQDHYGNNGINFENFFGKPIISDDTQMTLFTASGLIKKANILDNIWLNYQDWLDTQFKSGKEDMSHEPVSWLIDYPEIFVSREPGRTCLQTIMRGKNGTLESPINNSKGCGGVMRVAPIGLIDSFSAQRVMKLAAECSALTHGHPLSSIASAFMAGLIHQKVTSVGGLCQAIENTKVSIQEVFNQYEEIYTFMEILNNTLSLVDSNEKDLASIRMIGEGWVAEEALMIALYASLKYENNPQKAVEVAVNHDGDSDSTGALTGQILGAFHGMEWLPRKFISELELKDAIMKMGNEFVFNE